MKITGIDLSLQGTGVAKIECVDWTSQVTVETAVVTSKGKLNDSLTVRHTRQVRLMHAVLDHARDSDLVVIETLFSAANAGSLIDRAGLWWKVVGVLVVCEVPVVHVTATQGKKFLTGNGSADKGAMVHWASKMWPSWNPATEKNVNDEADALALASIGLALVDEDHAMFPMPEYRRKVISDLTAKQDITNGVPAC